MEAKKAVEWSAKMAKIEEISRKKEELHVEFVTQTKEALINKMGHSEEKREAIISDLKEKLKVILAFRIETARCGTRNVECNLSSSFRRRYTPMRSSGTRKCWKNKKSRNETL